MTGHRRRLADLRARGRLDQPRRRRRRGLPGPAADPRARRRQGSGARQAALAGPTSTASWACGPTPTTRRRAPRAQFGAEGIGLCRTEHMFFEESRLPLVQSMIMADTAERRAGALDLLLPVQRGDFQGLFEAMEGRPVIIRLLDPPLHEFLPGYDELQLELADLKVRLQHHSSLSEIDEALAEVRKKEDLLARVRDLRESNPMLGLRGVRLGVIYPEITAMQVRAILEAAVHVVRKGIPVMPEIMIPLTSDVGEIAVMKEIVDEVAKASSPRCTTKIDVQVRHDDRGPARRAHRRHDRRDRRVLQLRHQRPHPDDLRHQPRRRRGQVPDALRRGGRHPVEPVPAPRPRRRRPAAAASRSRGRRKTRPDLHVGICGEHGGDPSRSRCATRSASTTSAAARSASPWRVWRRRRRRSRRRRPGHGVLHLRRHRGRGVAPASGDIVPDAR
jgi:pyruvate, orthophosphate dikinase